MRLKNFSCSVFLGKFGGFHSKSLSMKKKGVYTCQKLKSLKHGIFRKKTDNAQGVMSTVLAFTKGLGVV